MKHNLLGISGKIKSGKDTVGSILQWIATSKTGFGNGTYSNKECEEWLNGKYPGDTSIQQISGYLIKKYADKTTKAFELITGVNYHKLSREDKEKIRPQYRDFAEKQKEIFGDDAWVNALFADYGKPILNSWDKNGNNLPAPWIITDVRFENEAKAIKDRGGIVIRVERPIDLRFPKLWKMFISTNPVAAKIGYFFSWMLGHDEEMKKLHSTLHHPSETALDSYEDFDVIINNEGSISDLIEKIKQLNLV